MTRPALLYLISVAMIVGVCVGLASDPTIGGTTTAAFTSALLAVYRNPGGAFGPQSRKTRKRCPHRQY
jgi:hypothetical protein